MATFDEVFWAMFKKVEESNIKLREKDLIIEELECRIADLENQVGRFRKKRKAKKGE